MEITIEKTRQLTDTVQSSHMKEAEQKSQKAETIKQSETAYDAVSSQGDTLYISESGRNAESDMSSLKDNQSEADGKVILKPAEEYVSEADDSLSTIDLSRYTELELRQMYLDGDITKSEYDEEIDSRDNVSPVS